MGKPINSMVPGFLARYREKKTEDIIYLPLNAGFLRLEYGRYDDPRALAIVSFVWHATREAAAVGPRLEMRLIPGDRGNIVTFIGENAVAGRQWRRGRVIRGHTYEDDSPGGAGNPVSLDEWVDTCVDRMINPGNAERA